MQDSTLPRQEPVGGTLCHSDVHPDRLQWRIIDLVLHTPDASVRLTNSIREAHDAGTLPFQTVGDFLAAGSDATEHFRSIPRLGTKSLNELQKIVAQFCFDAGAIPWATLSPDSPEVSVPPHLEVSLRQFIGSGDPVSVRLHNCIVYAEEQHLIPFATVGDYIRAGSLGQRLFRKLPNVGTGTAQEFHALVQNARGAPAEAVTFDNAIGTKLSAPSLGAINAPTTIATANDAIDLILDGRFPTLGLVVEEILNGLKETAVTIARMRFGQRNTLEAVAQVIGVTRERVRQIESRLARTLPLAKVRLIKSAATLLQRSLDAHGISEISLDDLALKCASMAEELQIFFGLLKQVEPEKHSYFTFSEDHLFLESKFAPKALWDDLVHQALIRSEMPITLEGFAQSCPDVPSFYWIKRLCKRYDASICDGNLVQQPALSTYFMCESLAQSAGGPFHFSELCSRIQERYGKTLAGHTVLATLGRMKEVAICGPGLYVHYDHLPFSIADRDHLCAVVEDTLNAEGCFLSSKVLFARLKNRFADFPGLNHYLLMGIVQDDTRFITKRGNMVGLNSFDIDATFTLLEDEVCNLVREFGPITIPEIMKHLSSKRELCNDSGIRLILSSEPWIVEVGLRSYDANWRILGSEQELDRYTLGVKVSLIGGPKGSFAIADDLRAVGLVKATPELVCSILESIDHVLVGASYRIENLEEELEAYAKYAEEKLSVNPSKESVTNDSMLKYVALDRRFKSGAEQRVDNANSELGAILAEFEF